MTRRQMLLLQIALPFLAFGCWIGFTWFLQSALMDRLKYGRTTSVAGVIAANKKSVSDNGSVRTNSLLCQTELQIRGDYGKPDNDLQGYNSLGLHYPDAMPRGPIRTLTFQTHGWFFERSGTLWVWVVEYDGEWVCFESCWFAAGVVF
jgi:hypothetical protein